jgi:hypothetical protein
MTDTNTVTRLHVTSSRTREEVATQNFMAALSVLEECDPARLARIVNPVERYGRMVGKEAFAAQLRRAEVQVNKLRRAVESTALPEQCKPVNPADTGYRP